MSKQRKTEEPAVEEMTEADLIPEAGGETPAFIEDAPSADAPAEESGTLEVYYPGPHEEIVIQHLHGVNSGERLQRGKPVSLDRRLALDLIARKKVRIFTGKLGLGAEPGQGIAIGVTKIAIG